MSIDLVLSATTMTGAGAFVAGAFTTLSPMGGAVFGISTFLSSRIIDWTITQGCCCCKGNPIFTIARCVFSILGGIAVGIFATKTAGFPLTFTASVVLSNAMLAAAIAVSVVIAVRRCLSWITTTLIPRDITGNLNNV